MCHPPSPQSSATFHRARNVASMSPRRLIICAKSQKSAREYIICDPESFVAGGYAMDCLTAGPRTKGHLSCVGDDVFAPLKLGERQIVERFPIDRYKQLFGLWCHELEVDRFCGAPPWRRGELQITCFLSTWDGFTKTERAKFLSVNSFFSSSTTTLYNLKTKRVCMLVF